MCYYTCAERKTVYFRVWRSLVSRLNGVQEAASSNLVTRTIQSVLIGSEYPVMDTLLFCFLQSSYCNLFRGVAVCYAFPCFHDNVGLRDLPAIRHIKGTDAVVVNGTGPACKNGQTGSASRNHQG